MQRPYELNQPYPVRFGSSFHDPPGNIHTIHARCLPESLDFAKLGLLSKPTQNTVQLQFQNTSTSNQYSSTFDGRTTTAKQDVVLIFDPVERCFRMERVSTSIIHLQKAAVHNVGLENQLKRKCEELEAETPAKRPKPTPEVPETKLRLKIPTQQNPKPSITQIEIPKKNTPPLQPTTTTKQNDQLQQKDDLDDEIDAAMESESSEDSADAIFRELGAAEELVTHHPPKPTPAPPAPQPVARLIAPIPTPTPKPQAGPVADPLNASVTHNSSSSTASSSTTDSSDDDSD